MKPKKGCLKLSFGRDIQLTKIPTYLNFSLVGRFCGKVTRKDSLINLMDKDWYPVLGYTSEFHILPRGWFLFKVKKEEDGTTLLSQIWSWGPSVLIMQTRNVNFNAKREPHSIQQIRVILPGLPMVFLAKTHSGSYRQ